MKRYIILYDQTEYVCIDEAKDEHDLILQFADYCGNNSDLFYIALKGCESIEDMAQMFNYFSQFTIDEIIEVGQILYDRINGD